MDENKTALTESLIIWVSFCFPPRKPWKRFRLPVCRWWGVGVSAKTIYQLGENEANLNREWLV